MRKQLLALGMILTFLAAGCSGHAKTVENVTSENFAEVMDGTWKSRDKMYIMEFNDDGESGCDFVFQQKSRSGDGYETIAKGDFSEIKETRRGEYAYKVEFQTSMEGMTYSFKMNTDGRTLTSNVTDEVVLYKK